MPAFDWLEKAQRAINKDQKYRNLGNADVVVAMRAGKVARLVTFEAFEVSKIEDTDADDLRDAELILDMPARDWTNYLKRRKKGTGPTLLSLDLDRGIVGARNPLDRLKFERFHRSLQAFVDQGAKYVVCRLTMPIYEYRCDACQAVTAVFAKVSAIPATAPCEACGSEDTHRIVSRPSVHRSNLSKVERLDPKYDAMVDRAMRNTQSAEPDHLINRRGDISKGKSDP